ncbi:MAG: hypothetical protein GXY17_08610 [Clostridiaceae bacterium]|nr:hypothetical protein [Clostridiaceae bacterium]
MGLQLLAAVASPTGCISRGSLQCGRCQFGVLPQCQRACRPWQAFCRIPASPVKQPVIAPHRLASICSPMPSSKEYYQTMAMQLLAAVASPTGCDIHR